MLVSLNNVVKWKKEQLTNWLLTRRESHVIDCPPVAGEFVDQFCGSGLPYAYAAVSASYAYSFAFGIPGGADEVLFYADGSADEGF